VTESFITTEAFEVLEEYLRLEAVTYKASPISGPVLPES
jgi:hypothetical protein